MKATILCLFTYLHLINFCQAQKLSVRTPKQIETHFQGVMKEIRNPRSKNILVVAHRGDWRNAPENSIQALKNCLAMGVDMMEMDLKMTKDSVLVLMHDKTIDRTTIGKGEPKEYMFEELKKLTLKSAHGCPSTHRIPTFEEFMLVAKGKMFINIDKGYPYLIEVIKVLKKTRTLDQVFVNVEGDYQKNISDYDPTLFTQIIYKPVVQLDKLKSGQIVNEYKNGFLPKVMEFVFQSDTSQFLRHPELLKNQGVKIWYNSLWADLCAGHEDDIAVEQHNTKDSWDWLIAHGASFIQTDRPKELLAYLKKRKLHQ